MENMSHFVEECDDIVMSHQCRPLWRRFREVRNHGSKGIATLAIQAVVSRQEWPHGCMGVFGRYARMKI
jgi:hypothetical protein